jgi:septal ring factor EnvC (AmiA/AmiB activator)
LNRDKGFLVFKNIFITDILSDRMDYLIKVERKSRKETDESIMYLVMLKDDKNALGMMDAADAGRAKSFLNNLLPEVEAADLELQIIAQQEVVAKAEKKLRDLKEEQTSLERKIADNKTNQDNTQKDIESQKQALGVLEGKRRTGN